MRWTEQQLIEIRKFRPLGRLPYCLVLGCQRECKSLGLCLTHRQQALRRFDAEYQARQQAKRARSRSRRLGESE